MNYCRHRVFRQEIFNQTEHGALLCIPDIEGTAESNKEFSDTNRIAMPINSRGNTEAAYGWQPPHSISPQPV